MSFFNELKRRNVFRVGTAYLVVSWLLLQVIDVVGDMLAMPDTFGRGVLILLIIGFPVALVISWVYEMTPGGITTQDAVDAGAKTTSGNKLNAVIMGGLAFALILVVLDAYVLDEPEAQAMAENTQVTAQALDPAEVEITQTANPDDKTIAVLPFINLSNDPDQEYFSDGLSEELLNKLAQVPDLLVAGRTSSFYYKGRNEDLRNIGETLGVAHILEGSVRKSGNQLRITAQLIKADDGFNVWSETFDRELTDVFDIQDEISQSVSNALQISLGAGDFDLPGGTRNVQAYDEYLQSRNLCDPDFLTIQSCIEHLTTAVSLDPDFALAWAELSGAYFSAGYLLPPAQTRDFGQLREQAINTARALAPDLPLFQTQAAWDFLSEGDWLQADQNFQSQLAEQELSNAYLNAEYGWFLRSAARIQESIPYLQRAVRIDPLNTEYIWSLSVSLLAAGRREEMIETVGKGLVLEGYEDYLNSELMFDALMRESYLEALEISERYGFGATIIGAPWTQGLVLMEEGQQGEALALLNEYLNSNTEFAGLGVLTNAMMAAIYGDPVSALHWLHQNGERRSFGSGPYWLGIFSEVRQLPEFKEKLRDSGLVDYWRSTGNWGDICKPLSDSDTDFECF